MQNKNKTVVKYISGYEVAGGVIEQVYSIKVVDSRSTRRYYGSFERTMFLNGCSRSFYDFILEHMTADNIFYANKQSRTEFINIVNNLSKGELVYSDVSIKKAIKSIMQYGLMKRVKRGVYFVNPECCVINNNKEGRIKLIQRYNDIKLSRQGIKRLLNKNDNIYRL